MPNQKRYPGSRPFTPDYSHLFFGRDQDIGKLSRFINAEKLSVLYGKSGLGKSSLLNAGVIPRLEKEGYLHIPVRFGSFTEDSILMPLDVLAQAIVKQAPEDNYLSKIEDEDISLWQHLKGIQYENKETKSLILVLDQFEELFTYSEDDYRTFAATLAKLLNGQMPRRFKRNLRRKVAEDENLLNEDDWAWMDKPIDLHVVLAIRSDKLSLLNKLTDSIPNILLNCYELMPLTESQAGEAIRQPAMKDGTFASPTFHYDDDTLAKMVNYLNQNGTRSIESFQLQILCQFVEERLVIKKGLTTICPDDLGELESVYQSYYDLHIKDLPNREDRRAARLLIEDGLIFQEDQRRISLYEGQIVSQYHITTDLLEKLVDTHLIRSELHSSGGRYYEISHDSLVKPILRSRELRVEAEERLARQKAEEARREAEAARTARRRRRIFTWAFIGMMAIIGLSIYNSYLRGKNARIEKAEADARAARDSMATVLMRVDSLLIESDSLNINNKNLLLDADIQNILLERQKVKAERTLLLLRASQALSEANRNSYAMVVNAVREEDKDPQLALGLALASLDFSNTNTNALAIAEQIFGRNTLYKQRLKGKGKLDGVALAPNGERLVTLSNKAGIAVWDINGAPLFKLPDNGHPFTAGSISPDSRYLITGDEEGHVHQWDMETGLEINEFSHSPVKAPILDIAISPGDDNHFLVVSGALATEYKIGENKPLRIFPSDSGPFTLARYSQGGKKLAIGDKRGNVLVFDKATSNSKSFLLHKGAIRSLAFSNDQKMLLTGSDRPMAIKLNLEDETIQYLDTGKEPVVAAAFTEDGTRMLTWTADNQGQIWTRGGRKLDEIMEPEGGRIRSAAFSPNGDFIVLGDEKEARVRAVYRSFLMEIGEHKDRVQSLAFSSDRKSVVTGSWDGEIQFWDMDEGVAYMTYSHSMVPTERVKDVNVVAFSESGALFASGSDEGSIYMRNGLTGAPIDSVVVPDNVKVHSLVFAENDKLLIAGLENGIIVAYGIDGGRLNTNSSVRLFKERSNVYALTVSNGGKYLAAGFKNGEIIVARVNPWKVISNYQAHQAPVSSLAFSPDGLSLITAGQDDKLVRIWDWQDQDLRQSISDHADHVNVVKFSPDGLFLTGSSDKTAILWQWDVARQSALPLRVLTQPELPVYSADFTPGGRYFALGYSNGKVRVYQTRSLKDVYTSIAPPLSPAQRARFGIGIQVDGVKETENAGAILGYANFLKDQAKVQADSTARRLLATSVDLYHHLLTEQTRQAALLEMQEARTAYEDYLVRLLKLGDKKGLKAWLSEQDDISNPEEKEVYDLSLSLQHVISIGYLSTSKPEKALTIFKQLPDDQAKGDFFFHVDSLLKRLQDEDAEVRDGKKFIAKIQESFAAIKTGKVRNNVADFIQNRATQVDRSRAYQQAVDLYDIGGLKGTVRGALFKAYLDYTGDLIKKGDSKTLIAFATKKLQEGKPGSDILVPDLIMALLLELRYNDAVAALEKYIDAEIPEEAKSVCKTRSWYSYTMKGATRDNIDYWRGQKGGEFEESARYHIERFLKYIKN